MAKPQNRIPYLGVGQPTPGTEHEPWMNSMVRSDLGSEALTLQAVTQHLDTEYDIEGRSVLYSWDEEDAGTVVQRPGRQAEQEDGVERTGYKALVNPKWERDPDACPQDTPVWHIATEEYTPVSPGEKYGPYAAALRANGTSQRVFGEVRVYRNGGEIHMDSWLPDITVELGGSEYIIGVQSGFDYYGGTALYATVVAAEKDTGTQMRGVTDKRRRSHRGSAGEEVADWWSIILAQAEQATDGLAQTVAQAQAYQVDFTELPISSEQYLLALFQGTASYAEAADERLAGGTTPNTCTAWDLYHAMASTLTQDFDGKDGSAALRSYLRGANEQLFSPPAAERTVVEWLEEWDELAGQEDLNGDSIQEQLRQHRMGLRQAVDEYKSTKDTLKRLLNDIEDPDND